MSILSWFSGCEVGSEGHADSCCRELCFVYAYDGAEAEGYAWNGFG